MSDNDEENIIPETIVSTMGADPEPEELIKLETDKNPVEESWEDERNNMKLEIEKLRAELDLRDALAEAESIQKADKPKPRKKKVSKAKGVKRSKQTSEDEDALLQRRMLLEDNLSQRRWGGFPEEPRRGGGLGWFPGMPSMPMPPPPAAYYGAGGRW